MLEREWEESSASLFLNYPTYFGLREICSTGPIMWYCSNLDLYIPTGACMMVIMVQRGSDRCAVHLASSLMLTRVSKGGLLTLVATIKHKTGLTRRRSCKTTSETLCILFLLYILSHALHHQSHSSNPCAGKRPCYRHIRGEPPGSREHGHRWRGWGWNW